MFIENYYPLLNRDIEKLTETLEQEMPEAVRQSLEAELLKLQDMYRLLSGEENKAQLHQLRARLRWARHRAKTEKDGHAKKKAADEVTQLEQSIAGLVNQAKKKN